MLPKRRQCKIIIATSLFWIFIDFTILLYYTAPCVGPSCKDSNGEEGGAIQKVWERANEWMNKAPEKRKQIGRYCNRSGTYVINTDPKAK